MLNAAVSCIVKYSALRRMRACLFRCLQRARRGRQQLRAVGVQRIKAACANQCLKRAPVDDAPIHAPAEIEYILKWLIRARTYDFIARALSRAFDRAKPVEDLFFKR